MSLNTKQKLSKANKALTKILRRILDINRLKKQLAKSRFYPSKKEEIKEELRILNKVAEQQAKLIALYENELEEKQIV